MEIYLSNKQQFVAHIPKTTSIMMNVISSVRDFFITGSIHPSFNSTNIVLVPKSKNPSNINHFQLIAVCNVIYKEVINAMKRKKGSKGWMGLKIDLQKAYDRLSWQFLAKVLKAFGFHSVWIHRVITCISTDRLTLMLNGAPAHNFSPKRGLRQGDPLSPYLFILAMEVLSRLINQKVEASLISGFRISRHTPPIHHLFFADDIFLLCKCTLNEANHLKDCLDRFCSWSGQSFNALKSNIFFNNSANNRVASSITGMMGFSRIAPNSVYLGLPLFRSGKIKDFEFLVEQLDSKLAGWKNRTLSKAKRDVLINSVALALPLYTMQSTKIPLSVF
ncbi:hypothetical protein UlMin_045645 [Ulmus minor]